VKSMWHDVNQLFVKLRVALYKVVLPTIGPWLQLG